MNTTQIDKLTRKLAASLVLLANLMLPLSQLIAIVVFRGDGSDRLRYFEPLLVCSIIWSLAICIFSRHRCHSFVNMSVKSALNFTCSICLYLISLYWAGIIALVLLFGAVFMLVGGRIGSSAPCNTCDGASFYGSLSNAILSNGWYVLVFILLLHLLAIVFGSIQAIKGRVYNYPLSIRFFK